MGNEEGGTSTSQSGGHRGFPPAAPPEIMKAAEKDDHYASFVSDTCRDAFRSSVLDLLLLTIVRQLIGQVLYYILTTGAGQQTLGEEYCDILQISGSYGLPPTPARRTLFVLYQTAVPYLAERMSSRIASRGMLLADSNFDDFGENISLTSSQRSNGDPIIVYGTCFQSIFVKIERQIQKISVVHNSEMAHGASYGTRGVAAVSPDKFYAVLL